MLAYTYDVTSGQLLGDQETFVDPNTGESKLPAHSTLVAPPEIPEGFEVIFDLKTEKWKLQSIKTELEKMISGELPIPDGMKILNNELVSKTLQDRLSEMSLTEATRAQLCLIADSRLSALLDQGFDYNGVHYQADQSFQSNMTAFLTAITAGFPGPVLVRTKDNLETSFTKEEFPPFAFELMSAVQAAYQRIWSAKDLIRQMANAIDCLQALTDLGAV